jgi:hypothetical protein
MQISFHRRGSFRVAYNVLQIHAVSVGLRVAK